MERMSSILATLLLLTFCGVSYGLQCRSCRSTHSLDQCKVTTCAYDEMCYVGDTAHLLSRSYTAKCMTAKTCSHLTTMVMQYLHTEDGTSLIGRRRNLQYLHTEDGTSLIGRRRNLVHMCDICCGQDLCNTKTCHHLRHELYQLYSMDRLNMTSLTEINP